MDTSAAKGMIDQHPRKSGSLIQFTVVWKQAHLTQQDMRKVVPTICDYLDHCLHTKDSVGGSSGNPSAEGKDNSSLTLHCLIKKVEYAIFC